MDTFAIGEVAIVAISIPCDGAKYNGREVTVTSELLPHPFFGHMAHRISAPWLPPVAESWWCQPESLRKRRPPPNWEKLATPATRPQMEPA